MHNVVVLVCCLIPLMCGSSSRDKAAGLFVDNTHVIALFDEGNIFHFPGTAYQSARHEK